MSGAVIGALIGAGLPGVEVRRLAAVDACAVIERAIDERAVSVLASAARSGSLVTDDVVRERLTDAHEAAMARCVLLEQALLDVAEILAGGDVEFRLLKGPAVAHLDYPDPAWRTFGDVDLLVRGADYDRAVELLEATGAHRRSQEVRPGFDRRFGKGVCMIGSNGVQVDLHRMLTGGPFGLAADQETLFADAELVEIGGQRLPTLPRDLRFLHACQHAVLGDWPSRLVPLRDVAQVRMTTDVDMDAALGTADRWRSTIVVARAVALGASTLELPDDDVVAWARRYHGSRFERRALAAYVGPQRSYARQMTAALPAVSGIGNKVAFVGALLLPDRGYVGRHDGGYVRRIRRAWRSRSSGETRSA